MKFIIINWAVIFLLMSFAFGLYLLIKNPGIIDVFWPISIAFTGIHFLWISNWNLIIFLLAILLLIWCFRLFGYLLVTRIIPNTKEERYVNISKKWKMPASIGFFLHFQFQGILAMVIATPFYWIKFISNFNFTNSLSIILIIVGVLGETIADLQLNNFKKNNKGEVCNIGLWSYSRHPNYFFEFLVWLGFGLSAISISPFTLMSPVILFIIMYYITGPITEKQSLNSRGDKFAAYQDKTAYFFPFLKNF